jgi:hypothetical protein
MQKSLGIMKKDNKNNDCSFGLVARMLPYVARMSPAGCPSAARTLPGGRPRVAGLLP